MRRSPITRALSFFSDKYQKRQPRDITKIRIVPGVYDYPSAEILRSL